MTELTKDEIGVLLDFIEDELETDRSLEAVLRLGPLAKKLVDIRDAMGKPEIPPTAQAEDRPFAKAEAEEVEDNVVIDATEDELPADAQAERETFEFGRQHA